jgi:hypothetical protein
MRCKPEQLGQYHDRLQAGQPRSKFQQRQETFAFSFFIAYRLALGAHASSHMMGTESCFPKGKVVEKRIWPITSIYSWGPLPSTSSWCAA